MRARLGLLALFFASGAAGLVLEVVWMRRLHLLFGSTALATAAVTAAFMAGLGLGSWLAARRGDRATSPLWWYAVLELGIGGYALLIPSLFAALLPLYRVLAGLAGGAPAALDLFRFLLAFLVLAPPTTAMGATLPLLVRHLSRRGTVGGATGALYAANTAGALVGVLVGGYVLLPGIGEFASTCVAVSIDLLVGAGAFAWSFFAVSSPAVSAEARAPLDRAALGVLAVLGISGGAAMACQVAWTRLVALLLGSSVYAFTCIVAAVVAGISIGSALTARLPKALARRPWLTLGLAECGAAVLVLLGALWVNRSAYSLYSWVATFGTESYWLVQLTWAGLLILPPSIAFGAAPPLAVRALDPPAESAGLWVGRAWAVNTVGALIGAAAGGLLLLPVAGMQGTLTLGACAAALAGALVARRDHPGVFVGPGALVVVTLLALLAPRWSPALLISQPYVAGANAVAGGASYEDRAEYDRWQGPAYHYPRYHREGASATVTVMADPWHVVLHVDAKPDASSALDMETQVLLGHIPMLLHPHPTDVMIIGLGSGVTVGAAALHPGARVSVVEIEPAVAEAAREFDHVNGAALTRRNVQVLVEDARTLMLTDPKRYDVIISEPSNPWLSGPAKLFTREFFAAVKARLKPGGVLGQWIHLYGIELEHLQAILRTFQAAFPDVRVFSTIAGADLLLLGGSGTGPIDWSTLQQRATAPGIAEDLALVDTAGAAGICSRYVAGPADVAVLAGGGPLNTDDNGLVEYGAGWDGWQKDVRDAVEAAVGALAPDPVPLLGTAPAGHDLAWALAAMAESALARGDSEIGGHWARTSVELHPSIAGYRALGLAREQQVAGLAAEEAYRAALAIDPNDRGTRLRLVQHLLGYGDNAPAYEVASTPPTDDPQLLALQGVALVGLGEFRKAWVCFERVPERVLAEDLPVARAWAGRAAAESGHPKRGIALLEAHVALDPRDLDALGWLRDALKSAGRPADARNLARTLSGLRLYRDRVQARLEDLEEDEPEVLPLLRDALQRDPFNPGLAASLVRALRVQAQDAAPAAAERRHTEALTVGREFLRRYPRQPRLAVEHAYHCELLAWRAGATPEARELYAESARTLRVMLAGGTPGLDARDRFELQGRAARAERLSRR